MHLVVLQHGLWGHSDNMKYLAELLGEQLGDETHVLNCAENCASRTYDGIDVCGDRLHILIKETMETLALKGTPVTALSMIGYSMGGLITRYTVGKLYAEGLFDKDGVQPLSFITVATPHLGAWRMPSTWYNRAYNYMVPVVTSRSGYQLVLQDKHTWGKPLLCLLSHPDLLFMRALRRFKKLTLYANVFHDRPVPYCTAAIRLDNPYEGSPPVPIDPKYPSIVRTAAEAAAAAAKAGGGTAAATAVTAGAGLALSPLYSGPQGADGADADLDATPRAAETQPLQPPTQQRQPTQQQEQQPTPPQQPQPQQPPLRPLRSTYLRFMLLLCLPLAIPALIMMTVTGRSHHCKMMKQHLDFDWIAAYHRGLGDSKGDGKAAAEGDGEKKQGSVAVVTANGSGKANGGGLPSDIECPTAPELPTASSASGAAATGNGPRHSASGGRLPGSGSVNGGGAINVTVAPASATASGALDDGDDVVLESEQGVLLHDGIVERPAQVHSVQEWLVQQLNTLPWHKIDVDCRDFHAHAAIIMRNPGRFSHNRDVLDFLAADILCA